MDFKRRVRDRICLVLLILWNIATTLSGKHLVCTNDYYKTLICHFEAQNCSEYNLTIQSWDEKWTGTFTQRDVGQCYCSVQQSEELILMATYTATVWKGGKSMESKNFSVEKSIKPNTPTIDSVKETNGNVLIKWNPNTVPRRLKSRLTANVTYHKKGDTKMVSASVERTGTEGLHSYEIQNLEPSTTYAVSVKTYTSFSSKYSDSSEEKEFTTAVSPEALPLALIIIFSFAAVIITAVIYVCFVKLKTKWADAVAKCPNPQLGVIYPSEQKVLTPGKTDFSILEVLVPDDSKPWSKGSLRDSGSFQQSSGLSSGPSSLSPEPAEITACVKDALHNIFPNIGPLSRLPAPYLNKDSGLLSSPHNPCVVLADDTSCSSSDFENKTYSPLNPCGVRADDTSYWSSDFENKTYSPLNPCGVRADDTSYWSSDFENKTYSPLNPCGVLADDTSCWSSSIFNPSCPHQSVTDSPEVQTEAEMRCDSAYHPQSPASPPVNSPPGGLSLLPTDMSYQQCNADSVGSAEDSSSSSVSSGSDTIATAGSPSFPPMDDDYQPFQNLVEQSDILVF